MSPEETAEAKAKALWDYTESAQEVSMLRDKISESGDFYFEVGGYLKTDPLMYFSKQYVFAPQSDVDDLVRKWMNAVEETERLKQKAISYGVSL
jgi:hypothetical protein